MDFDVNTLLIIIPLVFLGGFVDAIAGGGGIITMVGFILAGVPIHSAIGTNKVSALFGTGIATFNYFRKGLFDKRYIILSVVGSIIGGFLGSSLALRVNDNALNILMIIALPIMAILMMVGFKPRPEKNHLSNLRISVYAFIVGISVAFYDGLLGPGAGTLYIIGFSLSGLTLLKANGNAKLVNLVSNIVAAILFVQHGSVILWLVIPCIITSVIANYLGSKLAIENGSKIIKPVMIIVIVLLFVKTIIGFIA